MMLKLTEMADQRNNEPHPCKETENFLKITFTTSLKQVYG